CRDARCGDGFVWSGHEACDDRNRTAGDGCSASCRPEPVDVRTGITTCALSSIGDVKCWGYGAFGILGQGDDENRGDNPGEMGAALRSVPLGTGRRAVAIANPTNHECALLDDGTIKCWGYNEQGQLGLGDTENRGDQPGELGDALPAVDLGTGRTALAVSITGRSTCALLDDHSVKCWGSPEGGRLGLGAGIVESRGDEPGELGDALPAIDFGTDHPVVAIDDRCALFDDGAVKCWGYNTLGSLGLGDEEDRGDDPGEMGEALPFLDFGLGARVRALGNGCALLSDGSVKCWGFNRYGECGLGDTEDRGDEPNEMGDALPVVDLGAGARVAAVDDGCVLFENGSVKCWGINDEGELGLGDREHRGDEPGEMGSALPALDVGTERRAKTVPRSGYTRCVVLDDGTVKCWGRNDQGELGLGDKKWRGDEPGEMGDALPSVDIGF
ncbi:MAG TPA: hypothetical protein VF103_03305, partial [Polyangiaceae bacterium]